MDSSKMLIAHIATEVVVIGGVSFFLNKRISDLTAKVSELEKKLEKLPKIIIVPPKKQSDEETWNSGEVTWDPKPESSYVKDKNSPKESLGNGTMGYLIFPPVRPIPLSPFDFAMYVIF